MSAQFRFLLLPALLYKKSYFTTGKSITLNSVQNRRLWLKYFNMNDNYVEINGIPTRILTLGKWIEEPFQKDEKELILCITGNPGLVGFYTNFATSLFSNLDKVLIMNEIWV